MVKFWVKKELSEKVVRVWFKYALAGGGNCLVMEFRAFGFWPIKQAHYVPPAGNKAFFCDMSKREWWWASSLKWYWVRQEPVNGIMKTVAVLDSGHERLAP